MLRNLAILSTLVVGVLLLIQLILGVPVTEVQQFAASILLIASSVARWLEGLE